MQPLIESKVIVVQHNDFINARFDMTTAELKLFMAMVSRVKKDTDIEQVFEIPVVEVLSGTGGSVYERIIKAGKGLTRKVIEFETVTNGKKKWVGKPLMAICEYQEGAGFVTAQFNVRMKEHLVQLTRDFTIADLSQLLKLRSFAAHRLYWMLKQYVKLGKTRTLGIDELRERLSLNDLYPKYSNFKQRVLLPAQQELKETDLNFTFVEIKQGKAVTKLKFDIDYREVSDIIAIETGEEWEKNLRELGVSTGSVSAIRALFIEGVFPLPYIPYCIAYYKKVERSGGIKLTVADAVFKSIITQSLLERYEKDAKKQKNKPTPPGESPLVGAWHRFMEVINREVSPMDVQTWFTPIVPVSLVGKVFVIRIPSATFRDHIEDHFLDALRLGVGAVCSGLRLEYVLGV